MPLAAAEVCAVPEWPRVVEWVAARPALVESVYLLGSRMRGDHGPDSDLDIALIGGPGRDASLLGLPHELGGVRSGWIPLDRHRFDPLPRAMGIPWVLLRHGVLLWGLALLPPGRERLSLMNVGYVRHSLPQAVEFANVSPQIL